MWRLNRKGDWSQNPFVTQNPNISTIPHPPNEPILSTSHVDIKLLQVNECLLPIVASKIVEFR
jgi:hypothetical protein